MKTHFLSLVVILIVTTEALAQTNNSDRLLWYSGRILKPNVLLTATGDSVFYDPQKKMVKVVSKSSIAKQFDGMLAELNSTQKRIDAVVNKLSGSLPRYLVSDMKMAVEEAYSAVEQHWKPLFSNTIALPEGEFKFNPASTNATEKGGPVFFARDEFAEDESGYAATLNKFRDYWENHKDDDLGILPVPPRYNFSYCYPCDSIAQQRYNKELDYFMEQLSGTDGEMVKEAFRFCGYLQNSANSGKLDGEALSAHDEAWRFAKNLLLRSAKKAATLIQKYKDDAPRMVAAHYNLIVTARPLQLMGLYDYSELEKLPLFDMYFESLHQYFSNAMKEMDYSIGLNFKAIMRLERERQLIGKFISGQENLLEKYLAFNQFKVNSNITAKVSGNGGYVMGHVRGDNWFYAIVDRTSCRLNWVLASKTAEDRTAKFSLLAAEAPPANYSGTKEWQSQPPVFKIEFCFIEGEKVADSIFINTFHPEGFREKWLFPPPAGMVEVETVTGILMSSFLDIDQIKEESRVLNNERIEKMKRGMQDKYAKLAQANPGAMANMTQLMQADIEKLDREIRESLARSNALKYIFTPQVKNNSKEIFKERLNGKDIFPDHPALEYAWFHLTMEHDPEGPHRIPSILRLFSITK